MRALRLDFVRQTNGIRRFGMGMFLVSLAAAVWLGQSCLKHMAILDSLNFQRAHLQTMQRKESVEKGSAAEREQLRVQLMMANRAIVRLSIPWDSLFQAVETAVDGQISLLSIEPDTEKMQLRITGEAKDLAAMLAFQKRLNDGGLIKKAYVVSHQIQLQDAQRPVRFIIDAEWTEVSEHQHTDMIKNDFGRGMH